MKIDDRWPSQGKPVRYQALRFGTHPAARTEVFSPPRGNRRGSEAVSTFYSVLLQLLQELCEAASPTREKSDRTQACHPYVRISGWQIVDEKGNDEIMQGL